MRQVLRLWAPLGAFGLPSPRSLSAGVMAVPKPGLPRAASGPEEHPEASLHAQSFSGLCQCLPGQIQEAVATLPGGRRPEKAVVSAVWNSIGFLLLAHPLPPALLKLDH